MFFTGKLSWRRLILIGGICAAADVCADMLRAEQYEMKQTYAHPGIRIRSNRVANWYVLGEEVVFSPEKPIPGSGTVTVTLRTGDESVFLTRTLPLSEFNTRGWRWKSEEAGFYNVRFTLGGKALGDGWTAPIWKLNPKKNRYEEVARCNYRRADHSLVVVEEKARVPAEMSPQFNLCAYLNDKELTMARYVGFRGLRIGDLDWEKIEPEKGKFQWKDIDSKIALAEQYGFRQEDMLFTLIGVPRWASSRPDSNRLLLGSLKEYRTVVPKDLNDWADYLRALIRHFPKVRTYELWNEPHFPGYSIFWSDTPENHVRLMESGYRAIKGENPAIRVWWAGISKRYMTFYQRILELGGGQFFDVLSLHGTWQSYSSFSALEKKAGLPPKPKANSEWHANLIKPWQAYYPTEIQGARAAMLGFLHMIRQNVQDIFFFTMFNDGGCELDELADNQKYGRHDPNVSGLFRVKPYVQPRFIAASRHVIGRLTRGNLRVLDGWRWKQNGGSCAAQMIESDAGPLLLFWGEGGEPVEIPSVLLQGLRDAKICAADGRPVKFRPGSTLPPDNYYLASGIRKEFFQSLPNRADVLKPFEPERPLQYRYHGFYRPAPLFDEALNPVRPETLRFHPIRREITCVRGAETNLIQAEFAAGLSAHGLDLLVRVKDPRHHVLNTMSDYWSGDSVQFAIDCIGKGHSSDVLEQGVCGEPGKEATIWKNLSPSLEGDLPADYTLGQTRLRFGKAKVLRQGTATEYRIRISAGELYPFFYSKGTRLRFSILVNNNNGKERASYLEWSSGIGNEKDPVKFGTLSVELPADAGFSQTDLNRGTPGTVWKRTGDGTLRVETGHQRQAGVSTPGKPTPGGAEYEVEFEARGTAPLIVMVTGKGITRIDPLKHPQKLTGEWKTFRAQLSLPAEAETFTVALFAWQQKEKWFEIRKFRVSPRNR